MASPAEEQQASQAALLVLLKKDVENSWRALDINRLKQTLPEFVAVLAGYTHQYGSAAGTIAANFYDETRAASAVKGRYLARMTDTAGLDEVEANVKWATRGLWSQTPDIASSQSDVLGAVEKMVLNTGRDTILNNVKGDSRARGWARVPEPGACHFCALLATRGAVYKTRKTASFEVHDHCRCHVEPLFGAHYEPTAQVREWQAIYKKATAGLSGAEARKAFRHALGQ